ncbi:11448_t:CDS:2 [Entrophospora sp. SA101]|nr:2842_t:CDS:2 [Entrophospora sp. SA101]CAJ0760392.1 11448_t:CDS:2 [Entrophospora sp. SA101]CAJ0823767.1 4706_t:CDS:2 [Entrophospora sp. SA101]CAJ0881374.1 8943_t:CDS:2 [Entrophospora sp. SA101]
MSSFQTFDTNAFDAFKNFGDLTIPVKRHLTQVYGTLATLCVVAAIGTYAHISGLFFFGNFAFMEGLTIGPLIDYILVVDHSERIIMNASILTALVFGSFTLASLLTNKRSFIYLGGLLGSLLSIYFWMTFVNIFLNSKTLYSVELYLGLLMFSGYDLVGIFVRILLILFKESGDGNSSSSRRRNNRERRRADYVAY